MKFEVRKASDYGKSKRVVEITTLEELYAISKEANETLIVKFPGVGSNVWLADDPKDVGEITIYDDYME